MHGQIGPSAVLQTHGQTGAVLETDDVCREGGSLLSLWVTGIPEFRAFQNSRALAATPGGGGSTRGAPAGGGRKAAPWT